MGSDCALRAMRCMLRECAHSLRCRRISSSTPSGYISEGTGKWVRARYVAELHEIAAHYTEWEITGPAEIRSRGNSGSINPYRREPNAHLPPVEEPPPEKEPPEREPPDNEPPESPIEEPPIEDALERFLVLY
jgi:hypothetical protein